MKSDDGDRRLAWLLGRLGEDALTADEGAELALLLRDEANRRLYYQFIEVHAALYWRCHDAASDTRRLSADVCASSDSPDDVGGALQRKVGPAIDYIRRPTPFSLLAAAIVVGLLLAPLSLFHLSDTKQTAAPAVDNVREVVAHITKVNGARWDRMIPEPIRGDALRPGDELSLADGEIEVTFEGGTRVALVGDSRFRVESAQRGYVGRGSATAAVPPECRGFSLATAVADVVDLGTEFGLRVENGGAALVHVLDGKVEVTPRATTAGSESRAIVVLAGQSLKIDAQGRDQPYELREEDRFVRVDDLNLPRAYRRWRDYSRRLRQDPTLVGYYTFVRSDQSYDRLENVAESAAGKLAGRLGDGANPSTLPTWTKGRWHGKQALAFRSEFEQRVFFDDYPSAAVRKRLSVALWMRPTVDRRTHTILALWDKENGREHPERKFFLLLLRDKGLALEVEKNLPVSRFVKREDVDKSRTTVADGWVHVALTMEAAGEVHFFKNGKEIDLGRKVYPLSEFPAKTEPLVLGGRRAGGNCLDAVIDEFAVFRRVLKPREIREMYQAGKVK